MFKKMTSIGVMVACIFAQPLVASEETTKIPVMIPLQESGEKWELIREEEVEGQGLVEFMPEGQNPEKWEEVLTVHYFPNDNISSKQLYGLFMKDIESQVGSGKLDKTVFKETQNDVFAKWVLSDTPHDQSELVRIFSNDELLAIVRYTNRNDNPSPELMDKWKAILEKAEIQ